MLNYAIYRNSFCLVTVHSNSERLSKHRNVWLLNLYISNWKFSIWKCPANLWILMIVPQLIRLRSWSETFHFEVKVQAATCDFHWAAHLHCSMPHYDSTRADLDLIYQSLIIIIFVISLIVLIFAIVLLPFLILAIFSCGALISGGLSIISGALISGRFSIIYSNCTN